MHYLGATSKITEGSQFVFMANYPTSQKSHTHTKTRRILKEMQISDHLTCLLRNLYAGQEVTVRTGHGTMDRFQIRKGVRQGLFNIYAEYTMRNVGLD